MNEPILSFEEWWKECYTTFFPGIHELDLMSEMEAAKEAWKARDPEVAALKSKLERAAKLIKELEWSSNELMTGEFICPVCSTHRKEAHTSNCELNTFLKENSLP